MVVIISTCKLIILLSDAEQHFIRFKQPASNILQRCKDKLPQCLKFNFIDDVSVLSPPKNCCQQFYLMKHRPYCGSVFTYVTMQSIFLVGNYSCSCVDLVPDFFSPSPNIHQYSRQPQDRSSAPVHPSLSSEKVMFQNNKFPGSNS